MILFICFQDNFRQDKNVRVLWDTYHALSVRIKSAICHLTFYFYPLYRHICIHIWKEDPIISVRHSLREPANPASLNEAPKLELAPLQLLASIRIIAMADRPQHAAQWDCEVP